MQDKAIIRGGLILFAKQDAIQYVLHCDSIKRRILGIDGLLITDKTTQPDLEHSVDFSKLASEDAYLQALDFLKRQEDKFFFEVLTDD
jgi:hypothetical protein